MKLRKVISGGQTGADQAGLVVAKRFGLETGGVMPKGYKTLTGSRPDLAKEYGLSEHSSDNYVPRTYQNAKDSDGTVRLAGNLESRGEVCTLKAIQQYNKPHFDVDLTDPPPVEDFVNWIEKEGIAILNVAGNAEQTFKGSYELSCRYLTETFFRLGLEMRITDMDIFAAFGLGDSQMKIIYTPDRQIVDDLSIRMVGVRRARMHKEVSDGNGEEVGDYAWSAVDRQEHESEGDRW